VVRFLEALQRGWRVLLLVAIPVGAGVAFYAQRLPNTYTGTAVVSFAPRPTASATQVGADVVALVLPKYQVYAEADTTVGRAASQAGTTRTKIDSGLNVSIPTSTSNLNIAMSDRDPGVTSRVANAEAALVVEFSKSDPLLLGTEVQHATTPTSPSGPPRRLIEGAGALAGLLLGVGLMLLLDRLRPVVRTAPDASDATDLRLLGAIPRAVVVRNALPAALANRHIGPAVRTLRTQLERAVERRPPLGRARVLVVTSAIEQQGKTTIATLLAMAEARLQHRVLLIDGDVVRPSLDRIFRVAPKPGLAQALAADGREPRLLVREGVVPFLSVMPTAPDGEAGDLLAREMSRVLGWASANYDRVIVDAAPVLGNDAGPTLAALADDVLFVVRRGLRYAVVDEAINTLRNLLDAPPVGVVSNTAPIAEGYGYYD
jgi:Mrp family chromosome partitioning ATPase